MFMPHLRSSRRALATALLAPAALVAAYGLAQPLSALAAQSKSSQTQPAADAAQTDDRLFSEIAAAVARGDADQLLAAADAALVRTPSDRNAAARKIAVLLASDDAGAALRVYEAWAEAARLEDTGLLSRVARGILVELDRAPLSEIRVGALEARARLGDAGAREAIVKRRQASPPTADTWGATVALARLGDGGATAEVLRSARETAGSRKVAAITMLRGLPTTPALVEVIRDALIEGDDMVRDAAADAAAGRDAPSLVEPLRAVLKTARFTAPLRAAVALRRMGDRTGQPMLDSALKGELADARILAARAYVGNKDTGWAAALEPVLADPNQVMRIFAAELLLPVKPEAAMQALEPLMKDPNPVLRAEATRVLAVAPAAPLPMLRAALGDPAPWVRLPAAAALARQR